MISHRHIINNPIVQPDIARLLGDIYMYVWCFSNILYVFKKSAEKVVSYLVLLKKLIPYVLEVK